MKVSIAIPQYNRIELLLKSLKIIEEQSFDDIEVVVSDDCSTDDTEAKILNLQNHYRYPIVFHRFKENQGYDRNYRKCIELSTGDYVLVIGNDDTINEQDSIQYLASFLKEQNFPDIGYSNFIEENRSSDTIERVNSTKVHGSGIEVAIKHANGFSFVGGLIYKKSAFNQYNTDKHDGSIYAQMYLGLLMIASGCTLFTIQKPLILKDIHFEDGSFRWSAYRDGLPKNWSEYRPIKSGLLSVMNVLISACLDAKESEVKYVYKIMRRMYTVTYPYWIIQYKHYGSVSASCALIQEMNPTRNIHFSKMPLLQRLKLVGLYGIFSFAALITPYRLFNKFQKKLHSSVRGKSL